ncbi:MAG TPA: hypothetical protein VIY48_06890, partial [Candidatus Paceibacterota bacterium]
QAALTAAYTTYRTLYLPAGTYKITAPITLTASGSAGDKRGLRIIGDAPLSLQYSAVYTPTSHFTVLDVSSVAPGSWTVDRGILELTDMHNVTLENLWFLGNRTTSVRNDRTATSTGVRFLGYSTGHHIERCTFQAHRIGLDMLASPVGYSFFQNNVFTANWKLGAGQYGGDSQWIGNFFSEAWPANQSPYDSQGVGLLIEQGRSVLVAGGKIEWTAKGIQLNNVADVTIGHGLMTDKNGISILVISSGSTNKWAGHAIQISDAHFLASGNAMATGSAHILFSSSNSAKVTGTISGCTFGKGSQDAYSENDGTYCGIGTMPVPTTSAVAGSLAAGTYYYRVAARNTNGDTVASSEVSRVLGATGGVKLDWTAPTGTITEYRIFGRTQGTEQLLLASVPVGTLTFTDSGSLTPAGDIPPTITPEDHISFVGSGATIIMNISGNSFEGGATRGWIWMDGAAGSRYTVKGNSGGPLILQPQANVAVIADFGIMTAAPTSGTWT